MKTPDPTASAEAARTRREQDFQFQQAKSVESMNALARGVAHDFNNILAGILSSAELIKMDSPPADPTHQFLEQIFETGERAREMIRQLRDFSQRKPCERSSIALQPVLEECLQLLRSLIPDKVELTHDLGHKCPAIFADAAQIQQAVTKLCLNAWNSLPERKGHINVRLDSCEIDADLAAAHSGLRPGPHARISISDNGCGLSRGAMERIFEPFAFKSASGKNGGLDLFIVQEIVHAHGGGITLESAPGKGTLCRIYFPIPA